MKRLLYKSGQKKLVLYFQVHQPMRLRRFKFFEIGSGSSYFDEQLNNEIIERIAKECYLPANILLLRLIKKHPQIKVSFSISGLALDKLHEICPEVLYSFRALAETGCVEFLGETQYHSLSSLIPGEEFETQVQEHRQKIHEYLGVSPTVFRNTELIYSDDIASRAAALGFKGIFCDGIEQVLGYRSPHHLYAHPTSDIKILLRNYRLSDDIAFRFKQKGDSLTVEKYMSWLKAIPKEQSLINIAMDYETFGEHQKKSTGIFTFLQNLLTQIAKEKTIRMVTPSEAIASEKSEAVISVPGLISWADRERDLSAWLGNPIQQDAFDTLSGLEPLLKKIGDPLLLKCWRMLQTSDHFYYMSTKKGDDGVVHTYFSPYPSPYEAFINYMNVLSDFTLILERKSKAIEAKQEKEALGVLSLTLPES
jgi:alpha-amylase